MKHFTATLLADVAVLSAELRDAGIPVVSLVAVHGAVGEPAQAVVIVTQDNADDQEVRRVVRSHKTSRVSSRVLSKAAIGEFTRRQLELHTAATVKRNEARRTTGSDGKPQPIPDPETTQVTDVGI